MQPSGVDDWTAARLNRPLTSGDRLWTARGARAELHIGNAGLRLNGETSFTLSTLDDRRVQIQIAQGTLEVHVRQLYDDESFEVLTPNFTVNLLRSGDYRIDVDNDHDFSIAVVRAGTAQLDGSGQAVTVHPGEQVRFAGAGNQGTYDVSSASGADEFDQWCEARTRREDNAQSAQYVSRGVIGYEDLDDYGTWRVYAGYGPIWVPRVVVAGWAPYRFGHWEWIGPWGWTWVDDAPWGFAPFHYGRWVYSPYGWGWVPGRIYARPVYAPALVAWVGGRNWGVGFSFGGGVGWLPLGPREVYMPWYRASRHYWSNVNITNTRITNVTVINRYYNSYGSCGHGCGRPMMTNVRYMNRQAPGAMTVVGRDAFVNARPVGREAMSFTSSQMRNVRGMANIPAVPSRVSMRGGEAAPVSYRPPERVGNRTFAAQPTRPSQGFGGHSSGPSQAQFGMNRPGRMEVARPPMAMNNVPPNPTTDRSRAMGQQHVSRAPENRPGGQRWNVPRPPQSQTGAGRDQSANMRPQERVVPRPENGNMNRSMGEHTPPRSIARPDGIGRGANADSRPSTSGMPARHTAEGPYRTSGGMSERRSAPQMSPQRGSNGPQREVHANAPRAPQESRPASAGTRAGSPHTEGSGRGRH